MVCVQVTASAGHVYREGAMSAGRSEGHRCSGMGWETDLLCKALGPEEEPQQAPYDHSQH